MEQPPVYIPQNYESLTITPETKKTLNTIATWARVLAIAGFFGILIVIMGTYIIGLIAKNAGNIPRESQFDAMAGVALVTIPLIVITIFYFYALYKMLIFSSTVKRAIRANDSETLSEAFSLLKSHYKSLGIMLISSILYYIAVSIIMGIIMAYGMAVFVKTF